MEAIDGRPYFAKRSTGEEKQEEIAAIDPDSEWGVTPVPDLIITHKLLALSHDQKHVGDVG